MRMVSPLGSGDDPRPLYVQIMEALRRQILSGQIRDRLTGEIELAQKLGPSRGTVQQAIGALVREGLLNRRRGLGTFVNADRVESYYREISSFTGAMKAQGRSPCVRLLALRLGTASPDIAARLSLKADEDVFFYARTVHLDEVPIVLTHSDIPAARFPGLSISEPDESLYKILRQEFGVTPFRARDSYLVESASSDVAKSLQLQEGSPVFRVERVTFDQTGSPMEYAVSWFNKGRLTVEIAPMSLFLEEQFHAGGSVGQWHHQVMSEY